MTEDTITDLRWFGTHVNIYGSKEDFLRFNIVLLYDYIGPALGPEPLSQVS